MPKRKSAVKLRKLPPEKEENLIDEVKQRPALYDVKNELYYNSKHKAALWDSIAGLLQEQKETVQDSWDSIKAKFKRESNKVEAAAAKKQIYNPNWIHFDNLAFIKDARVPKVTSSNLDVLFQTPAEVTDSERTNMHTAINDLAPAKLRSTAENVGVDNDTENDEDMTFFISLLKHVKKVPEAAKLGMKNELNKIVKKYAYENQPISSQKYHGNCTNCCSPAHCCIEPGVLRERQIDGRTPYAIPQHSGFNSHHMVDYYKPSFIKKEKKRRSTEVDYECETDDSDCMFVGEAKVVKKIIKRKVHGKTQKKENLSSTDTEESSLAVFHKLGINPVQTQQLYDQMIRQKQHLNVLKYLNLGLYSDASTHSAVPPSLTPTYTLTNLAAVIPATTTTTTTTTTKATTTAAAANTIIKDTTEHDYAKDK